MRARLVLASLALAGAARAAPSGLAIVPTADVVPDRQWTAQLQNGNTALRGSGSLFEQPEPSAQLQAGFLRSRVEAGCDLVAFDSPHDYRAVVNVKALVLPEGWDWPALAVGVAQLGHGLDALGYAVASRTLDYGSLQYQRFRAHHRNLKLRGVRLHAGVIGAAGDPRALAGTDVELSDHAVLQADWISGRGRAATLGLVWVLSARTGLQAALLRGNDTRRLDGLQVGVTRQLAW